MYFFYFDESGSRDPSIGTPEKPKDYLYVLLAVGMYEREWKKFEKEITNTKQELADYLHRIGHNRYDLTACEVKSNWLRHTKERQAKSPFLHHLEEKDRTRLVETFMRQLDSRKCVVMATVIDKRYLLPHMTSEMLHKKAYEFMLERIEHYMNEYHPKHLALIVMDDTSKQLNQAIALKHAYFQRAGNQNMRFNHIVEYPFFTRSELSNGVQLADLLAYDVYRAFHRENFAYPYFQEVLGYFYRRKNKKGDDLSGLKIWPDESPLKNWRMGTEETP